MTKQSKRNYHMSLTRTGALGVDWWRCGYCGVEGRYDDLQPTQCSHVYMPCKACGGDPNSNECKPDCPALIELFADPKIYVAGTHGPKD